MPRTPLSSIPTSPTNSLSSTTPLSTSCTRKKEGIQPYPYPVQYPPPTTVSLTMPYLQTSPIKFPITNKHLGNLPQTQQHHPQSQVSDRNDLSIAEKLYRQNSHKNTMKSNPNIFKGSSTFKEFALESTKMKAISSRRIRDQLVLDPGHGYNWSRKLIDPRTGGKYDPSNAVVVKRTLIGGGNNNKNNESCDESVTSVNTSQSSLLSAYENSKKQESPTPPLSPIKELRFITSKTVIEPINPTDLPNPAPYDYDDGSTRTRMRGYSRGNIRDIRSKCEENGGLSVNSLDESNDHGHDHDLNRKSLKSRSSLTLGSPKLGIITLSAGVEWSRLLLDGAKARKEAAARKKIQDGERVEIDKEALKFRIEVGQFEMMSEGKYGWKRKNKKRVSKETK